MSIGCVVQQPDAEPMKAAILRAHPELADGRFRFLTASWDSIAVEVDERLVFKFPRHGAARKALLKEAAVLALIRPAVTLRVPDLRIHEGPPLFSEHARIPGEHLVTGDYERLDEEARECLGRALGRFCAELHALDRDALVAAGAGPIVAWATAEAVRVRALPALPRALRRRAERVVAAFEALPPDPHGATFGHFDGHGWNMAFDHEHGRLVGVYDFGDSGFGPLHQEFVQPTLVSPDLTARMVRAYEAETSRRLDRRRIAILTGMHRLSELAALADDPAQLPEMRRYVELWAATDQAREM